MGHKIHHPSSHLFALGSLERMAHPRGYFVQSLVANRADFIGPAQKIHEETMGNVHHLVCLLGGGSSYQLCCWSHLQQLSSQSNIDHGPKPQESSDLLAFWSPFLLLQLGGPDTITAFALEDNQLWQRHLFSLVVQATFVLYVFFQLLPNEKLWIPTAVIFLAGIIKSVERLRALYIVSFDAYPGPDYARLMEEYSFKRKSNLPTRIILTPEPDKEVKAYDVPPKEGRLNHLEVVHYAYKYFKPFRGLIFDVMIFSFRGRYIFRFIALGSVLASLGIFYFQDKNGLAKTDGIQGVDIGITYILLFGAIALDIISFLMLIFSDQRFASTEDPDRLHGRPMATLSNCFLALKKPRWHPCKYSPETAKRISMARGDWVLTDNDTNSKRSKLLKYVSDVTYDESLLLWHIATDLCYHTYKVKEGVLTNEEEEKVKNNHSHRQFNIGTRAEAKRFFERRRLGPNEENARKEILSVNTDAEPVTEGRQKQIRVVPGNYVSQRAKQIGNRRG
ncbi:hypothetical protein DITRI_Ditri17bG0027900 [Diplodiscus trichospermus]